MEITDATIDAHKFRRLRGTRTQQRQAELLGMTGPSLSNMECGRSKPTGEQLLRTLLISGASPWDLVAEEYVEELKRLIADLPPD